MAKPMVTRIADVLPREEWAKLLEREPRSATVRPALAETPAEVIARLKAK